jgi:hypothetical protein
MVIVGPMSGLQFNKCLCPFGQMYCISRHMLQPCKMKNGDEFRTGKGWGNANGSADQGFRKEWMGYVIL